MITLNRLGHSDEPFQLNPDMVVTVESTPDTVITLATGAKVVVAETPEQVAARPARLPRRSTQRGAAQPPASASARPPRRHARAEPALRGGGRSGLDISSSKPQLSRIFPQRR